MNPKTIQQLVQFLSTTTAVAIGGIIAYTYITWEEKAKPPKSFMQRIKEYNARTEAEIKKKEELDRLVKEITEERREKEEAERTLEERSKAIHSSQKESQ